MAISKGFEKQTNKQRNNNRWILYWSLVVLGLITIFWWFIGCCFVEVHLPRPLPILFFVKNIYEPSLYKKRKKKTFPEQGTWHRMNMEAHSHQAHMMSKLLDLRPNRSCQTGNHLHSARNTVSSSHPTTTLCFLTQDSHELTHMVNKGHLALKQNDCSEQENG